MARNQIITVKFVDDLTGKEYEEGETISYSFDGTNYEVDLNATNAAAFRKAMAKYTDASRIVTGKTTTASRSDLNQVRKWARNNGMQVSDRGRVSAAILSAYDKATESEDA